MNVSFFSRADARLARFASAAPRMLAMVMSAVALSASAQGLVVSESGQAVYSYPIVVPPGVAGMEPKLSLVYNSGGMNGPMGVGWSVQGLSQITRCPKIEPVPVGASYKPRIVPVAYVPDDNLCLDGQRLVKVVKGSGSFVGEPAADQSQPSLGVATGAVEYRTENDSFSRIKASGFASTSIGASAGPGTFTVQTKAGLTQVYGLVTVGTAPTTDGVVKAVGGAKAGVATAWLLKTVTDSAGNAIEFQYDNTVRTWGTGPNGAAAAGGEWNLQAAYYGCNYGVNQACTARHKVQFNYIERSDKAEAFHLAAKVVSTRLLSSVGVWTASGAAVRNYQVLYTTSDASARQLATSIKECAGNAQLTCMPATRFTYSPLSGYAASTAFNLGGLPLASADGSRGALTGDFNGDGKTDILWWRKDAGAPITQMVCENDVCTVQPTGSYYLNELWLADTKVPGKFNKVPDIGEVGRIRLGGRFDGRDENDTVDVIVTDINGDGRADLVRLCKSGNTSWCPAKLRMWLSVSDNDPTVTSTYGQFVNLPNPAAGVQGPLFAAAGTAFGYVCQDKASGNVPPVDEPPDIWHQSYAKDAYWQDFDGDGRLDLITMDVLQTSAGPGWASCPQVPTLTPSFQTMRYYVGRGNGQFELKQTVTMAKPHRTGTVKGVGGMSYGEVLDVNGDGRPDLLFLGSRWMQDGSGNFQEVAGTVGTAPGSPRMLVVDANGDGKSDIILMDPTGSRTVPSPIPGSVTGATPVNVAANPYEARLYINQGDGSFALDNRPLAGLYAMGSANYFQQGDDGIPTGGAARHFAFGSGGNGSVPMDTNGDGQTDYMVWIGDDGRHELAFYTSLSGTDAGKTDGSVPGVSSASRGAANLPEMMTGGAFFYTGDFLGLGSPGFLRVQDGSNNTLWYRNGVPPDMMTSVANVSGVGTAITYASTGVASDGITVGQGGTSVGAAVYADTRPAFDLSGVTDPQAAADLVGVHTWPTLHLHPAQWLVSRTQQASGTRAPDASGLQVTTAFAYVGMKSDLSGGGSLGLEAVTKYFPYASGGMMASTTEYLQPLNASASSQDGTQRKQFVGMPKCSFTRYLSIWTPNVLKPIDVNDSRNTRPGSPRQRPLSVGSGTSSGSGPNVHSECFEGDGKSGSAWSADIIGMTNYTYCDVQAQANAGVATMDQPCASTSLVKRPYQVRSVERKWDLTTRSLLISKTDTVNTAMTVYGDVSNATITTTGYGVGGPAGKDQMVTKTTKNTYLSVDDGTERFISGDKWFLGRLGSSKVTSTTSAIQPPVQSNGGLNDIAKATQDPALNGAPPKLIRPEVLMTILQMLLED
jgi:hypothetical protein